MVGILSPPEVDPELVGRLESGGIKGKVRDLGKHCAVLSTYISKRLLIHCKHIGENTKHEALARRAFQMIWDAASGAQIDHEQINQAIGELEDVNFTLLTLIDKPDARGDQCVGDSLAWGIRAVREIIKEVANEEILQLAVETAAARYLQACDFFGEPGEPELVNFLDALSEHDNGNPVSQDVFSVVESYCNIEKPDEVVDEVVDEEAYEMEESSSIESEVLAVAGEANNEYEDFEFTDVDFELKPITVKSEYLDRRNAFDIEGFIRSRQEKRLSLQKSMRRSGWLDFFTRNIYIAVLGGALCAMVLTAISGGSGMALWGGLGLGFVSTYLTIFVFRSKNGFRALGKLES